jgi:hypothetical protein
VSFPEDDSEDIMVVYRRGDAAVFQPAIILVRLINVVGRHEVHRAQTLVFEGKALL